MFNIFTIIDYSLKAKQGYQEPEELISETSFGLIESFFIISFIILGLITGGLGFLVFYYGSIIVFILALLFGITLSFDIWIYIKVKSFFKKMSKKVVDYSRKESSGTQGRVIDIN